MSARNIADSAMTRTGAVGVNRPVGPRRIVCLADTIARDERLRLERRSDVRFRANDVWWLRGARLRYGSSLRILNIAATGILIETDRELAPGATIPIELLGPRTGLTVLAKVVRCRRVTSGEIAWHHTACRFLRPIDLRGLVPRFRDLVHVANSLDAALIAELDILACQRPQRVVARYRSSQVFSGYTKNFHPGHTSLRLSSDPLFGKSFLVPMSDLKTLVFVRHVPYTQIVSVDLVERVIVRSHVRNLDSEQIEVTRSDNKGMTVYFDDPVNATHRWIHWTVGSALSESSTRDCQ